MATRSRNGLGSLLGILVVAAIVFFLLNLFGLGPFGSQFGCGPAPAIQLGSMANAASENSCPGSVEDAANDPRWAVGRLGEINDERVTTGTFFDEDGTAHTFDSAQNADSDRALEVGRAAGLFPASGRPIVVDHVEVKVAAAMRDGEVAQGVLVINNSAGPCRVNAQGSADPASCLAFLPGLLPAGATLTVWWPDPKGGTPHKQTFAGGHQ